MASAASNPATVTIDLTKDLQNLSNLKTLFTGKQPAIFSLGSEMAKYAGQPIQSAVGSAPVKLTIQGEPKWKLPSGISFSLSADAKCTLAIGKTSAKFSIVKSIDSKDKIDVVSGPTDGVVYVNIELDFDIKGNLSGSGKLDGVGIAGKASGSESATMAYCHPVSATMETVAALKAAFSGLIFPFEPDCAVSMPVGSVAKVNFDGSLNCELDITYGFADYKLSAPTLGQAQGSVKVAGEKLKPASLNLDAGAKASLSYTHSDNFSVIVQKTDAGRAFLHLLRSADDETKESVGITLGITAKQASVSVDKSKLTGKIKEVTQGGTPNLEKDVATYATDLQNSMVAKANKWLSSNKGNAGLALGLSQQHDRTALFVFKVDLSSTAAAALSKQSWAALLSGDLGQALKIGGFALQPDSGISESFKRSCSIQLHFFNFQLAESTDFFKNSVTKLGPDGSIRFFVDIGQEAQFSVDSATATATIHFVATASEDTAGGGNYKDAEVDLYIELSETKNPKEASKIANSIGSIAANAAVQNALAAMSKFVANYSSKKLTLISIFKASAYEKLACSEYTVDAKNKIHPPAIPEVQDQHNWEVFQTAAERLMKELSVDLKLLRFNEWMLWNVGSNYQIGDVPDADHVPDRRHLGNYAPAGEKIFQDRWPEYQTFLPASAGFMNLCDDLHSLASSTAATSTPTEWQELLSVIEKWVTDDTNPDWSKPALSALLSLCSSAPFQVKTDLQQPQDNGSFTCTLTLS